MSHQGLIHRPQNKQNFQFFYISLQSRCAISTGKTIRKIQLSICMLLKMTQNKNEKTSRKTFKNASKKSTQKPPQNQTAKKQQKSS